jgi:hypothetical protein
MILATLIRNIILGLVIASIYNLKDKTGSFYEHGSILYFAVLLNAFASALEILIMWQQRPIVEKHVKYALYH